MIGLCHNTHYFFHKFFPVWLFEVLVVVVVSAFVEVRGGHQILGMELQMAVRHHVGARNSTQVLSKKSNCS